MNILHLTTHDWGGAGKAVCRLHENLLSIGLNSKILVRKKLGETANVIEYREKKLSRLYNRIMWEYYMRLTKPEYSFRAQPKSMLNKVTDIYEMSDFKPDIIVVHWLSGFISVKDIYKINSIEGIPIVWYLLDMAPFTGGCHYAWDCRKYTEQCEFCPAFGSKNKNDASNKFFKKKLNYIQKTKISIVACTEWLLKQAGKASIFKGKELKKIMLSVDPEIFNPTSSNSARTKLGISHDSKVMFFNSSKYLHDRKGISYLMKALNILARRPEFNRNNLVIITAGDNSIIKPFLKNIYKHHHLGYLDGEQNLARAYQAADVFVCSSVEDSGPMMINESIMCGTPVVSFEMGVALDLVHTGITGYRARLKDSKELANGMARILNFNINEANEMSERCRSLGLQFCHPNVQAELFKELFTTLLNKRSKSTNDNFVKYKLSKC